MKYPIPQGATAIEIPDPIFIFPDVPPVNLPPTANAGSDVTVTLPTNSISLVGIGADSEGKAVSFKWEKVSGVGSSIVSPASANTVVSGLTAGSYTFRVTVTDDIGAKTSDDVNILVKDAIPIPPQPAAKYEGFGSQAVGGSQVVSVANKAQFDAAVSNPNGKIIRFTADASFTGRYEFSNKSFFTIDGNGFDVTIDNNDNGDGISIGSGCHHVIVTGIRVINGGNDGINVIDGAHDVLIDHCSVYDNRDGNLDFAASNDAGMATKNVTVQNTFFGKGQGSEFAGDHLNTAQLASSHHNLFAPGGGGGDAERCPYAHSNYSPVGNPNHDFRNNLIFGWGRYASGIGYKATGNFVNNYYASNKAGAIDPNADPNGNGSNHGFYFVSGNVQIGGANINLGGGNHAEYNVPDPYKITMTDAKTAAQQILKNVGLPKKTAYEQSVINSITIS